MISLGRLLLILFVSIVAISVLSEGIILYFNTQQQISSQVEAHLVTAAESRAAHIRTFLEDKKSAINSNAQGVVYKDLFALGKNDPRYFERYSKAKTRLIDTIAVDHTIYEIFILDTNGIIVVSSDSTKEGLDRSEDEYYINGKNGVYLKDIYFSDVTNKYGLTISAPMQDGNKKFIGMYVARISIEDLDEITQLRSGLGASGEIFLLNLDSYMITPSKYLPDVILKKQVNTPLSRACIADIKNYIAGDKSAIDKTETDIGVFNDYRGVPSLGAHAHISPEANWCLIAKMDEKEALGGFRSELQTTTLGVAIVLLIIFSIVSYYFSHVIISPIKKLSGKISQITKGDLEVRLDREGTEELQGLVDSLNRVLASMKLAMLRSNLSASDIGLGDAIKAKQEAEKEVKIQKEFLNNVINSISDPIFVKNEKHEWVLLNEAFCKFMGRKKEELLGKSDYAFFPKKQADVFWAKDELIFKTGKENVNEEKFTDAKGNEHIIVTKKSLYYEKDGSKILVGTISDITQEKKIKEDLQLSEENFKNIFDNAPVAMYLNDLKGNLVDGNIKIQEIVGYKKEELKGRNVLKLNLVDTKYFPILVKNLALNVAGKSTGPDRVELIKKNKSKVLVEVISQPIYLSGKKLVLCTVQKV